MKTAINITLGTLLLLVLAASSLQAQQCSTRTTAGRYLVRCDGFLTPGRMRHNCLQKLWLSPRPTRTATSPALAQSVSAA